MKKINLSIRLAVLWNDTITNTKVVSHQKAVTCGAGKKATLSTPKTGFLGDSYTLLEPERDGACLQLNSSMNGWVENRGERIELDGSRSYLSLESGDRGLIYLDDDLAVFFQIIEKESYHLGLPLLSGPLGVILSALIFSVIAHFAPLCLAFIL